MLWIYLPSSTDLKLCSDVPTVNFVDTWTFVTVFMSRYLGPNIWVLANRSKMICQPLGHFRAAHFYLAFWQSMSDFQILDSFGKLKSFHIKSILITIFYSNSKGSRIALNLWTFLHWPEREMELQVCFYFR